MFKLHVRTNTYSELVESFVSLYDKTTSKTIPIRRIGISLNRLQKSDFKQYSLFVDSIKEQKEGKIEKAIVDVKVKMGLNSIVKGMNLQEGANQIMRNGLVGGHKAG
jgi:DNA polymerase V